MAAPVCPRITEHSVTAKDHNYDFKLLKVVEEVNDRQREIVVIR